VNGVRRVLWDLGAPARALLIAVIRAYRVTFAGMVGGQCRFYPSCSHYAEEAIRIHGAARGSALAAWRVLRCGPFTPGGVDRVPAGRRGSTQPAARAAALGSPSR
jgi:putative membrane protein insertion efficiency factor